MEILLLLNCLKNPTIAYRVGGMMKNREKYVRNVEDNINKRPIGTKHKINYLLHIKAQHQMWKTTPKHQKHNK